MTSNKRKLIAAGWITLAAFVVLTSAAYAWMSISSSIKVTDLSLNLVTENALELALDQNGEPGEWTTVLSMNELLADAAPLSPVTWSAARDSFLAPHYGLDGRPDFSNPLVISKTQNGVQLPSSDEAEKGEGAGTMLAIDLWVRTGSSDCTVRLSQPAESSEGTLGGGTYVIGAPVWDANAIRHTDGGSGAQAAIRIAFQSYDETYDPGKFVIYEPNTDGTQTTSVDGTALEGSGKLITQAPSSWSEQTPVLRDSVNYILGEFLTEDTGLFMLKTDTARHFTMYIWLEGQDADCTNAISAAQLLMNVQFGANTGNDKEVIIRPNGG